MKSHRTGEYICKNTYLIKNLFTEYVENFHNSVRREHPITDNLNRQCTKKEIGMENKHMKRCSTSRVIRNCKLKPQWNTTTCPLGWLKFSKLTIATGCGNEKWMVQPLYKSLTVPYEVKHTPSHVCVCSVMSDSLRSHGLSPTRLFCPWDFPGKNTGVGCPFLFQGIFLTWGSNFCLLCFVHWQVDSSPLHHLGHLHLAIQPEILLLGIHWREMKTYTHSKICMWTFTAGLFIIIKNQE